MLAQAQQKIALMAREENLFEETHGEVETAAMGLGEGLGGRVASRVGQLELQKRVPITGHGLTESPLRHEGMGEAVAEATRAERRRRGSG